MSQDEVDPVPVDYAVADTQGAIGYMFVKALTNELTLARSGAPGRRHRHPVGRGSSTIPPSRNPTKPIGSFLTEGQGSRDGRNAWMDDHGGCRPRLAAHRGLASAAENSWRPRSSARSLDAGAVVVAAGGGGIPVAIQPDGQARRRRGCRRQGSRLGPAGARLSALTCCSFPPRVPRVAIRFGTPEQQWLDTITVEEARAYIEAGEFGDRKHGAEGGRRRRLRREPRRRR